MRLIFSICFYCILANSSPAQDLTAYIFMAEECPVCNYLGKSLKKLSTDYESEVQFIAVFPQRMSNIKTASLFKKKYDLTLFQIEIDQDQLLTHKYNANVTPEVVLVNKEDSILYKGRIDDSYAMPGRMRHGKIKEDLRFAIEKSLEGIAVEQPWPDPVGCYITKR